MTHAPPPTSRRRPGASIAWRRHRAALPPLLALLLARLLFLHGDPSDFAQDRNFTMAAHYAAQLAAHPMRDGFWRGLIAMAHSPPWLPEFPFAGLAAWIGQPLGVGIVLADRILSLLLSMLTGWGLYRLGRRMGPPRLGLWALWLFTLAPMSVFMGRAMLPDTAMMAGVAWMFVSSGADARRLGPPRLVRRTIFWTVWIVLAGLAKLPGVWFAPAAALGWMQSSGWRRRRSWIVLAVAALLSALAIASWYRLGIGLGGPAAASASGAPTPGSAADSASLFQTYRFLIASLSEIFSRVALRVALDRLLLVLTLPGFILAMAGLVLECARAAAAAPRPRRPRAWLAAWWLLSLVFVWITVKANAYWAYAALPAGCLLVALTLEAAARRGRWVLTPLLAAGALGMVYDPSLEWVGQYLAVQPAYREAADAARRDLPREADGAMLYRGMIVDDLAFTTGRPGLDTSRDTPDAWRAQLNAGRIASFLDLRLAAGGLDAELFRARPVVDTRPRAFILFDTRATDGLGEPAPDPPPGDALDLNLGGNLTLLGVEATPRQARPGDRLQLRVTYARGEPFEPPPALTLLFVHTPTGEAIPLPPRAGGAILNGWAVPLVQTPDFRQGARAVMTYDYNLPSAMPDGPYRLRWMRLAGPTQLTVLARAETPAPCFTLLAPEARAPWRVDPLNAAWLGGLDESGPAWLGRVHRAAVLAGASRCWLGAPLPAGDYELRIHGRGVAAGPDDRWPRLRLRQPGRPAPSLLTFDAAYAMTARQRLHWNGPQDLLDLSLDNPWTEAVAPPALPLYLSDPRARNRSIILDWIEWAPVKGG